MRDDTIIVRGPYELPPVWVPGSTDEVTGEDVPGNLVPSENLRYIDFESRECPCGQIHTFTLTVNWGMMLGHRQVAEYIIDAGYRALAAALEDCEAVSR